MNGILFLNMDTLNMDTIQLAIVSSDLNLSEISTCHTGRPVTKGTDEGLTNQPPMVIHGSEFDPGVEWSIVRHAVSVQSLPPWRTWDFSRPVRYTQLQYSGPELERLKQQAYADGCQDISRLGTAAAICPRRDAKDGWLSAGHGSGSG